MGDTFIINGLKYRVLEPSAGGGDRVAVIANDYTGESYDIPGSVRHDFTTYTVAEIAENAFFNRTSLERVSLPKGLETIGDYAFYGCASLESATFPEGLKSIGHGAFYGCASLKSVTLRKGLESIGNGAFEGCTSLATATFPEGLESIGHSAFASCLSLATATLPVGLKSIDENAFINCTALTTATFPEGLEFIGDKAFQGCASLAAVSLPEGLESVGAYAFRWCTSLATVSLSEGLKTIEKEAFAGCTSLATASLPEGLESIGHSAFGRCEALTSVVFPKSLESVGMGAFRECDSLVATFKGGTVKVGAGAFFDVPRVVVDGGSVAGGLGSPVNSAGAPVHLAEVTLRLSDDANSTLAPLVELVDLDGKKIAYGLDLAYTDGEGKAYLWLPEGTAIARVVAQAGPDGSTRAYVPELGRSLTVAAGADNWAVFRAEQVGLRVMVVGEAPLDVEPAFLNFDGKPVTASATGQRVGLDVTDLEDKGLRIAGLYLASAAYGGGPRPGTYEIEEAFTRGSVNYRDVYRFWVPESDATVYCVVAPEGGPDPVLEPRVLTDSLPRAVQGGLYVYRVAAVGPKGSAVGIEGLPYGLEAEKALIGGAPQAGGPFDVKVSVRTPESGRVEKTLVLEVDSDEPRSVVNDSGDSATGYIPREAELVVGDLPFGIGNMREAAGELGLGAIEAGPGGTYSGTDASGGRFTFVPVMEREAHLEVAGERLDFQGRLAMRFLIPGFEPPADFTQGALASFVALHAPEDGGGVQVVESGTFELREVDSALEDGMKLVGSADDMYGQMKYVDNNVVDLELVDSRSLSPFALYLKVEGEPIPAPTKDAPSTLARTGDAAPLVPAAALAGVSGALITAAALRRRRER